MNDLIVNIKKILNKIIDVARYLNTLILLINVTPIREKDFIIVTAADSSHHKSLKNLLSSIVLHEKHAKVIIFDLGLTKSELMEIKRKFKKMEIRKFNFSKYPSYLDIKVNAGEYAWKPVIISNILNEFKCSVIWMDAGNIILSPLRTIKKILNFTGFYVPYSRLKISDTTHYKTLKFLKVSKDILYKQNVCAACIAVNYKFNSIEKIISKWKKCALIKKCIAPKGSSRKNHRQDQAVLGVLAHQADIINPLLINMYYFGFKIQQDID
jgi:hypothetical protein